MFEAEQTDEEEEVADMDQWSAGIWLVIITVITSFCADVLVGSIDETAQEWHIPKRYAPLLLQTATLLDGLRVAGAEFYQIHWVDLATIGRQRCRTRHIGLDGLQR